MSVSIDIAFELSQFAFALFGTNNLVRISIFHTNNQTTASLIAKSGHIAKDTTSSVTWFCLGASIVRKVSLFGLLEFNLILRLFEVF